MTDPTVGVVLRRDQHPGAGTLQELQLEPGRFACDASLPLSEALAREWDEDAHVLQYALYDEDGQQMLARVRKVQAPIAHQVAKAGGGVRCSILCLDHDLPGHREWADAEEPLAWLASVPDDLRPTVWYSTLHGSRLLYVLAAPLDRLESEGLARALVAAWGRAGVAVDPSSAEWTRLFRLPRTRRADTGLPFWEDPRFYMVDGGPELDPSTVPHEVPLHDPTPTSAGVPYAGGRPDAEACRAELEVVGEKGRPRMTEFAREARRWLRGRESFALAFEDGRIDAKRLEGGWNNAVLFHVGQVVSMLAHLETATPEGCFALLRPALEQLSAADETGGKDWEAIGWDQVRRIWGAEEARLGDERRARKEAEGQGAEIRSAVAAAARAAAPEEVPGDAEGAEAWVKSRMIASDGQRHYVMRRDGSYNLHAVGDSMLVPMIRELGMEDAIPTKRLRGHELCYRGAGDVLAEHAVPVLGVRCSAREKVARVDGPEGERVLRVPIHRLNPRLSPAFSPAVDEWLRELFGPMHGRGVEWLAQCLEVTAPICALNLHGASGSGKAMLTLGISECFEGEAPNDGRAMDRFNIGLLRSPVLWCDEGIPQIRGLGSRTDEVFRQIVAGGTMQIEGKMRDIIVADMYPRVILTSNNADVMAAIVGARALNEEDVRAIEQRLLSIPVGPGARRLLESRGAMAYTRGWVAGAGPSNYVVANHVAFLHATRGKAAGRFLVEGEVRTELVKDLRLRSEAAQSVLRALARMLDSTAGREGLYVSEGRAWVTVSCVADYVEVQSLGRSTSMLQVGQVLRQFSTEGIRGEERVAVTTPPGCRRRARWVELDLAALLEQCLTYGMACDRIEAMLRARDGGAGAVAEAKLAAGAGTR